MSTRQDEGHRDAKQKWPNHYIEKMWCIYPTYSWHVHFLPVEPPSSELITPSKSLHEHETGEEKAERMLAVLQVKSHVGSKMTLYALGGRTLPNGNTTQDREKIWLLFFKLLIPILLCFLLFTILTPKSREELVLWIDRLCEFHLRVGPTSYSPCSPTLPVDGRSALPIRGKAVRVEKNKPPLSFSPLQCFQHLKMFAYSSLEVQQCFTCI